MALNKEQRVIVESLKGAEEIGVYNSVVELTIREREAIHQIALAVQSFFNRKNAEKERENDEVRKALWELDKALKVFYNSSVKELSRHDRRRDHLFLRRMAVYALVQHYGFTPHEIEVKLPTLSGYTIRNDERCMEDEVRIYPSIKQKYQEFIKHIEECK